MPARQRKNHTMDEPPRGTDRKKDRMHVKSKFVAADTHEFIPSFADTDTEDRAPRTSKRDDDIARETFRIEVGHVHGVKPGNIVGAIANEAGLEGRHIGRVDIRDDHSFVDLPEGMPKQIFRDLQKTRVAGQALRISRVDASRPKQEHFGDRADKRLAKAQRPERQRRSERERSKHRRK